MPGQGSHKILPPRADPQGQGAVSSRQHLLSNMVSAMEVEAQHRKL